MRKIYFGTEEEILAIRIGEKTGLTKQTVLDTKWKKGQLADVFERMEANSWWLRAFALTSVGGGLAGIAGNIAGSSSVLALGLAIMAAAGGATFFYDRKNSHIAEGIERAARPSGDNPAP